jgi:menaquinol-cytochrome c reductase iron-sulfur subunit
MLNRPADQPQPPRSIESGHEALEFPERRSFLGLLLGVGTVVVGALLSIPLVGFVLFPLFRKTAETEWADAGPASDFTSLVAPVERQVNVEQVDAWREIYSQKSVFVIPREGSNGDVRVLSPVCPHLGCMVHYDGDQKQFLCPCHGSIFAADGSLVQGPALRGMDSLPHKIEKGRLMVLYEYFQELITNRKVIG